MAPSNTVVERLASLEANLKHISDNADRQRDDLLERINSHNEALRAQIADLKLIVLAQIGDAKNATEAAAKSAATANNSIAEFTNKLKGAKLVVAGLIMVAGAIGAIVFKFMSWLVSTTTH